MPFQIPHAGLQLEEDLHDDVGDLPTQAFILDLSDDVIDGMIESLNQGLEIRLSLGNTPTLLYGSSSHHIEPTTEDDNDDLELFQTDASKPVRKAERLPQLAMSLFRKPELGNPWAQYRTSSSEDEGDEYDEEASPEPEDAADPHSDDLSSDIALLRNSMAQKEAEKREKSTKVIEGSAPTSNGKSGKRAVGSVHKSLSGRHSPFGRASLSPLPGSGSPSLSAGGSPSLAPNDSQNAIEKAKQARSPIIHELAFKEQPYDLLWQKYPGASEADFKAALEKVADLDDTHNYVLRKKYWKELDVWNHEYASSDERQQAIDNAVRQFDKMRLGKTDPEWEKLLPKEERGQGRILSKIHNALNKPQQSRMNDSGADSGRGSGRDDSAEYGGNRTDDEGIDSESATASHTLSGAVKKKVTAQEKRLLSSKKKTTSAPAPTSAPSSIRVSPVKPAAKAAPEKQAKFKSDEFVVDSDSSDAESESAPLSTAPRRTKMAGSTAKSSVAVKSVPKPAPSHTPAERPRKAPPVAPPTEARKPKALPLKDMSVRSQITSNPLQKKRVREDDEDSSSSSSSGTPLSKRIKPLRPPAKALPAKDARDREKTQHPRQQQAPSAPLRAPNISPNSGSSSGNSSGGKGSNGNSSGANTHSGDSSSKPKSNNSPVKSSPLASSPPTNASELDLSSEESVPPISNSSHNIKRKLAEERRKHALAADSSSNSGKLKKRRHLSDGLVEQAQQFKVYYEKYEALYKDIASRSNPPKERVSSLLQMHSQLEEMKRNIYSEAMIRA